MLLAYEWVINLMNELNESLYTIIVYLKILNASMYSYCNIKNTHGHLKRIKNREEGRKKKKIERLWDFQGKPGCMISPKKSSGMII